MKFKTILCSNEDQAIRLHNMLADAGMHDISHYSLGFFDGRWAVQFLSIGREHVERAEKICNDFIENVMMKEI